MSNRFSHIFRSAVIVVLITGFAAHLSLPFFSDVQKNAFTQWLNQKVVANSVDFEQTNDLRDRINKLPAESPNFFLLVQDASKILSEYTDEFKISPFSTGQTQDHDQVVLTWLIGQWNTFKHQQSTANAVIPETLHPLQKSAPQPLSFTARITPSAETVFQQVSGRILSFELLSGLLLSPPASGISINAP